MKNYTVYFEIYGKNMKTTVMAENEIKAVEIVKSKINIYKVEKTKDDAFNEAMDIMDTILGGKKP